jgi:hypothetical protein
MKDLANIPYVPGLRLASLDISNMYTNISINELLNIMEDMCINNGLEPTPRQEILRITRLIVTQNYFKFQDKTYIQKKGLAMGAPTSSFLSEIFLQHIENTKIVNILHSSKIEGYYRYVDDIIIIYNESHTDIEEVQRSFNDITPSLNFTLECEKDGEINFLDLTLTRKENELSFDIFRKHTTTDTIIPQDSCHPMEQKIAAIRYYVNRIDTYNLDQAKRQKEMNTIKQIVENNKYETSILNKIRNKRGKQEKDNRKKWAKFTYTGKETRFITKLFKNTDVKVAYTTNNSLGRLLAIKTDHKPDEYDRNGVYQLECPTCNKKYIGQTGRPFRVRFREHYNDYRHEHNRSKFAQHVLEEGHSFGPMNEVMKVVHFARKGKMLDTLERFYIYKEAKQGNQINDKLTFQINPIFEAIVQNPPPGRLQNPHENNAH